MLLSRILEALALAVTPVFVGPEPALDEAQKPVSTLSPELGGTWSTGNTEAISLNGALHGLHRWGRNQAKIDLVAQFGQAIVDANADGHLDASERASGWVQTARKYDAAARYDRFLSKKTSLYGLVGTLIDPFAGYANRSHAQVGLSRRLFDSEPTKVTGELGADMAREQLAPGLEPSVQGVYAARGHIGIEHGFNPNVAMFEGVQVLENMVDPGDVRLDNEIVLTAALSPSLALKLTYRVAYDREPVEGFESVDQTTLVTFVAKLGGTP